MLAVALAVRAAAAPAPCPGEGFDAPACDAGLATAAAGCAPRGVRAVVRTTLRRVNRQVGNARRAATGGEPHVVTTQLGRAADRVAALEMRLDGLRARGRLADACALSMMDRLDTLARDLATLRAGPSTTTTATSPATSSTAATGTLPVPTTTTATTTTTSVPTCGNGRLDPGEQCDGTNLFGRTCLTLGFHGGGQLMCKDCLFDNHDCRF
jgi:hypothetical protein